MTAENTTLSLEQQISNLEPYLNRILAANNNYEKLAIINEHPLVQAFLNGSERTYPQLSRYLPEYDLPIRSIIAIGQGPIVFNFSHVESKFEKLDFLLKTLLEIESFYEKIGGIIGYHISVLKLLCEQEINEEHEGNVRYIKPEGTDINQDNDEVRKFIRAGIQYLPKIAEMYPVGGAGDRLNLIEEASGEHLPAARLPFIGKSLLEGLIRDLQAREYLYNRLLGEQVTTPIAMMTSVEKNNHQHILGICRENEWFGRPQHSFRFFLQPLAPVITREGNWSLSAPLTLTMKPGGHGVIWKLALEHDIFSSFESEGRRKVLVRQINNPVAGSDYHLLAFSGLGLIQDKDFGFASAQGC